MERDSRGFTLLELLVVIGIVVTISGIALTSLPILGRQTRVNAAAEEVLNAVREARHNSVSITELPEGSGIFPSYGIFFNAATPNQFIIYADCIIDDNNDAFIDNKDNFAFNPASTDCDGGNGFVETVTIASGAHIKEIRSVSEGITDVETKAYIEYLRPEPSIWISDSSGIVLAVGRVEVDIADISNSHQKTITFWTTGQVEISSQPLGNESYTIQ